MSQNIHQIFVANPITVNAGTDLMYFGQSPYGATNDAAMQFSDFAAQFASNVLTTKGDLYTFSTVNTRLAVGTTDGQILQVDSAAATGLAWSTASYPNTTTINQILYSSAANTVAGITTANNGVLTTDGTGVPSITASLPAGFVYIHTIDQTTASATLAVNTQYITDAGASLVTYTLPTTCAIGSIFIIIGSSSGGWTVAQNAGQTCHVGAVATTTGVTGSLSSSNQYDCMTLVCVTADTNFVAHGIEGNITIV